MAYRRRNHLSIFLSVIAALMILLILYALSIGPVYRLVVWTGNEQLIDVFRVVYWPTIWAYRNTPLRQPIGWYIRLWGGNT